MKNGFAKPAVVLLACVVLLAVPSAEAAVFMKIDGLGGDASAQDRDHQDWIEIQSFSTSMNVAPMHAGTGAGQSQPRGEAIVQDVTMTKYADKASPYLSEAVCKGKVFPKVEIHVTASYIDGGRQTYYRYELKNVMVTSYSVNASGSDDRPTENFSLNFAEVKVEYDQQGLASKSKGKVESIWKVEEGEK